MCGIVGFTHDRTDTADVRRLLATMQEKILHRGPDDGGQYVSPEVGMAMRRLSIIDLAGGHQPLANEDGTVWVVFNGEIYNYPELRSGLLERGHTLATSSDTEVLVHLYEERGPELVQELNGEFAFSIWDQTRRRLLLARDRLGIKPLYYAAAGGALAWASEIKSLLCLPWVGRGIDPVALDEFLGYRYVLHPRTLFSAVRKLPPGHRATWERGVLSIERYWSAPLTHAEPSDFQSAQRELSDLLSDSVRRRLVADVQVGAFLSGGLDSSLMTAIMQQESTATVRTFSIAFEEATRLNEAPFAEKVARAIGTEHVEFLVRAKAAELLPKLVWHLDDPLADPAVLPTYQLSLLARKHITVALSGEGADELFAGYDKYRTDRWMRLFRAASGPLRTPIVKLARRLGAGRFDAEVWNLLLEPDVERWLDWDRVFRHDRRRGLLSSDVLREVDGADVQTYDQLASSDVDPLTRMQWLDVQQWLPEDLLMKADKMAMAASLEVRVPYLDHRVVEWALTRPANLRIGGGENKRILRRLAADRLPPEISARAKHGFTVPISAWLRGELAPAVSSLLGDSRLAEAGLLRGDALRALIEAHASGREEHGQRIWTLLILELWYRIHVLGELGNEVNCGVWVVA